MMLPNVVAGPTINTSPTYRGLQHSPTDSWEIDLCVSVGIKMLIIPCWTQVKQLGRSLVIFKVHKDPEICEVFFMARADVVATYKDRMPQALEWCSVYDPEGEVAFWAELFQPSNKSGRSRRGSSAAWLTDELCGGFGSRLSLVDHVLSPEKLESTLLHVTSTQEEMRDRARAAAARIDKAQRKKGRRKQKKAAMKQEEQADERQRHAEQEAAQIEKAKAGRIPAPQLHAFDWAQAGERAEREGAAEEDSSDASSD
jgi:hypothetical protein